MSEPRRLRRGEGYGARDNAGQGKHSVRLYAGRIRRGKAPAPPKGAPAKLKILWGEEAQRNE